MTIKRPKTHLRYAAIAIAALASSWNVSAAIAYTYTSFDLPDQTYTIVGINDNNSIAGYYYDSNVGRSRSFVLTNGTYAYLGTPSPDTADMWAQGINNQGDVVGIYTSVLGTQGFKSGNNGFDTISVPGSSWNYALAINGNGTILGHSDSGGFILAAGNYSPLSNPTPTTTFNRGVGISNNWQIVGSFTDENGDNTYVRNTDGSFSILPRSPLTAGIISPVGINDSGQVIGWFQDGRNSFVYSDGEYTKIAPPDTYDTYYGGYAAGINNLGQIVGGYSSDGTNIRGFIATPSTVPIPAAVWLFSSVLAGLGIVGRRRSKELSA